MKSKQTNSKFQIKICGPDEAHAASLPSQYQMILMVLFSPKVQWKRWIASCWKQETIYLHSSPKLTISVSIREYSLVLGGDATPGLQILPGAEDMELPWHAAVSDRCRCKGVRADLGLIM